MSDNNKQLPAVSDTADSPAGKPRLWPIWLVLVLLVLLIGALAFGLWEQYRQQQSLQERYQQLEGQSSELRESQSELVESRQERLNQFAERLEKQRDTIESQRDKLDTQARQIEHNARALLGLGKRTRTDWLLAEAEYLLRLANQRLQMEKDHRGALQMLESADGILAETDDAGVYPVRQQLSREILALRTLEPVDRTGLYLQLEAAMGMVGELGSEQLFGMDQRSTVPAADDSGSDPSSAEGWQGAWQRALETLNRMVVIRRLDEPAQAMLSPEQSAQARLHLQLMFEQAAVALLQQNQSTYRRALHRADAWLDQWYDTDNPRVETLQQLIDEVAEQRISVTLPDISESLSLLRARVERRLEEGGDGNGQEADDAGEEPDTGGDENGEPRS